MSTPNFELPEPSQIEAYRVVALSTGHLTIEDRDALQDAADDAEETMVMSRSSGFFIKLCDLADEGDLRHGHSESIKRIIQWAKGLGFQMIELDMDADTLPCFPIYDW